MSLNTGAVFFYTEDSFVIKNVLASSFLDA